MELFKNEPNPVGRPSNESLKKKRNKKILVGVLVAVALLLVGGGAYLLISGTDLTELMGNSVTKTTVSNCLSGSEYNKTTKRCEREISLKDVCPTGGYTYKDGKCQKQKSSTSGIQATYDSTTKTYKCPSDSKTSTTITKYVKSGQKTCTKNVYEIKNANGICDGNRCVEIEPIASYNVSKSTSDFKVNVRVNSKSFDPNDDFNVYILNVLLTNDVISKKYDGDWASKKIFIDMYELKNGKYTLYESQDFSFNYASYSEFSVAFDDINFTTRRTFMFKYRYVNDITGETFTTNLMNKVILNPSRLLGKPKIAIESEGPYKSYIYIKSDFDVFSTAFDKFLDYDFKDYSIVQYYEVVNGKNKLIKECPYKHKSLNLTPCVKAETGKQYRVRIKTNVRNGNVTYSDYSDILKAGSTKPSS